MHEETNGTIERLQLLEPVTQMFGARDSEQRGFKITTHRALNRLVG